MAAGVIRLGGGVEEWEAATLHLNKGFLNQGVVSQSTIKTKCPETVVSQVFLWANHGVKQLSSPPWLL